MNGTEHGTSWIGQWDDRIEELDIELARLRNHRDAAAPGDELHQLAQSEANRTHWSLLAHRTARPVLAGLYKDLDRQMASDAQQWEESQLDAATWMRIAVGAGLVGSACLLVLVWTGSWWPAIAMILSVVACVWSSRNALAWRGDRPDPAALVQLNARIEAIRQACADCDSSDGLDHVKAIIRPPRSGKVPARVV